MSVDSQTGGRQRTTVDRDALWMTSRLSLLVSACLSFSLPALAQGQGSYGGIGEGFFEIALYVIAVVIVLVALLLRAIFGTRVMLVVVVVGGAYLGFSVFTKQQQYKRDSALRKEAYFQIDQALAQGCANARRRIEHPAQGNEPVYIRLHGAELVTERHYQILPTSKSLAPGVELLDGDPPKLSKAILVDITYSEDWIRSLHPGFTFHRLRYDLSAKTFPEGTLIASTTDMTSGESFCLGDFEDFLRRALNRPQVTSLHHQRSRTDLTLPDIYVQSEYVENTQGMYLRTDRPQDSLPDIKAVLREHGCRISGRDEEALCGEAAQGQVTLRLDQLVGLVQGADSWLLVYKDSRGSHRLRRLLVERRRPDWQLSKAWGVTVVPPADLPQVPERVGEISVNGESMMAAVYTGQGWDRTGRGFASWSTNRLVLKVPLPGFVP